MREHSDTDELRKEYTLDDFPGGLERGKYAARMAEETNIVRLDPDVARAFPDSASVNEALRFLLTVVERMSFPQQLPQADSIEALAKFWDTHDVTEIEDQLEEVAESIFERPSTTIMEVRLQPQEAETVKSIAESKEIDQETLLREWVLEKLHEE